MRMASVLAVWLTVLVACGSRSSEITTPADDPNGGDRSEVGDVASSGDGDWALLYTANSQLFEYRPEFGEREVGFSFEEPERYNFRVVEAQYYQVGQEWVAFIESRGRPFASAMADQPDREHWLGTWNGSEGRVFWDVDEQVYFGATSIFTSDLSRVEERLPEEVTVVVRTITFEPILDPHEIVGPLMLVAAEPGSEAAVSAGSSRYLRLDENGRQTVVELGADALGPVVTAQETPESIFETTTSEGPGVDWDLVRVSADGRVIETIQVPNCRHIEARWVRDSFSNLVYWDDGNWYAVFGPRSARGSCSEHPAALVVLHENQLQVVEENLWYQATGGGANEYLITVRQSATSRWSLAIHNPDGTPLHTVESRTPIVVHARTPEQPQTSQAPAS